MSNFSVNCAIFGGGIVGLAVAWRLLEKQPGLALAVLEKEPDWALHQTGRNSGVIHSGIYYKPGSLKAKLCREGNQTMVAFCREHGIAYEICGKVIVATNAAELPRLQQLYERGIQNGLAVSRLSAANLAAVEPYVQGLAGLLVSGTGIVDFKKVCRKLAELVQTAGAITCLGTEVERINRRDRTWRISTSRGELQADWIINCTGLHSDRIARLAGQKAPAKIVPFRGEYYVLIPEKRYLVKNLIYPVPDPQFPFLGVHLTRMIDGSVHAGPNAVLSFKREGYKRTDFDLGDTWATFTFPGFWRLAARHASSGLEEIHRSISKKAFLRSLQKLLPQISEEDLVPGEAGVRAQAVRIDGALVDDFLILQNQASTHVCNAPSPAATASLEIGRMIAAQIPDLRR
ncbi:MAG: L-2-hydroxyglutarate oxidase [Verrucomicrobia bacterium]|nr:L-2-hydroxyglutarate oxidase [Verrucomicrobiota bacterium]